MYHSVDKTAFLLNSFLLNSYNKSFYLFHLMNVFQEPGFAMAKLMVTTKIQIIAMGSSRAQIRLPTK